MPVEHSGERARITRTAKMPSEPQQGPVDALVAYKVHVIAANAYVLGNRWRHFPGRRGARYALLVGSRAAQAAADQSRQAAAPATAATPAING